MATLVAPPTARVTIGVTLTVSSSPVVPRPPTEASAHPAPAPAPADRSGRPRLLVVEPDGGLRSTYSAALSAAGHDVAAVPGLADARAAHPSGFDCVVLDRAAPGGDPLALVDELYRAGGPTRVVLVASRSDASERVEGLARGADDYLAQPVRLPELVTRVVRLTRCRVRAAAPALCIGRVRIDQDRRVAHLDDREIELTPTQYELLLELARQPGHVVRTRHLLERAWDDHRDLDSSVLRPHVTRLRKALHGSVEVRSVRGVGYVLEVVGATVAAGRVLAGTGSASATGRDGARVKTA